MNHEVCGCGADEVAQRGIGYVCNTAILTDFSDTIRTAMSDDDAGRRMSETGHSTAPEFAPSPESWGDQLHDAYESLIVALASE